MKYWNTLIFQLFNKIIAIVVHWFRDLLSFRTFCENYEDVLHLVGYTNIRVADMSNEKSNDDGYLDVHVYFQLSNYHYPIEIQYNTYYDRQLNYRLNKYVYKRK